MIDLNLFNQPPPPAPKPKAVVQVRDTSLEAYVEHAETGKLSEQQQTIMYFMRFKPDGVTRNELATGSTMRLSSVCGRVNELIKKGLLEDGPRRRCTITGINSHVITAKP